MTLAYDLDIILRDHKVLGDPGSGAHAVVLSQLRQYLKWAERAGPAIVVGSLAELNGIVGGEGALRAEVRGAANGENGYYRWDGGRWTKVAGLDVSFGQLTNMSGTPNEISAALVASGERGTVVAFVGTALYNNEGGGTFIAIDGVREEILTAAGDPLPENQLIADQAFLLMRAPDGTLRCYFAGDAATAAAQAAQSAVQAQIARQAAESATASLTALQFTSRAVFEGTTILPGVVTVEMLGIFQRGDCGHPFRLTRLDSAPDPVEPWHWQSADGGYWLMAKPFPSPREFGARGNYASDDTASVRAWLRYGEITGLPLGGYPGVYRCTESFELPEGIQIYGSGAPVIAAYPQYGGDKSLLRPGYKHRINGMSFVFSGTPTITVTTPRNDRFAVVRPCMYYKYPTPPVLKDFAILQDMDVFNASGQMTSATQDNRAAGFTCGLWTESNKGGYEGLTVFGYFDVQGVVVANFSPVSHINPDYNGFRFNRITSGLAVISTHDGSSSEGNTGLQSMGNSYHGPDHHDRRATNTAVPSLYIDGDLTTIGHIRGHSFTGDSFRTIVDDAIVLDHCDDIQFANCITEFSQVSNAPGLDGPGRIRGSGNVQSARLTNIASTHDMDLFAFMAECSNGIVTATSVGPRDGHIVSTRGSIVWLGRDSGSLGAAIHFTSATEADTLTKGLVIKRGPDGGLRAELDDDLIFDVSSDGVVHGYGGTQLPTFSAADFTNKNSWLNQNRSGGLMVMEAGSLRVLTSASHTSTGTWRDTSGAIIYTPE
ncbi:pectate lyase family protein [Pseudovibrio exalbescens]|uniref:Uncharacterized protein n=1 Tax=Pseudovibrio exalbescens TaxID=197461 RepID=A0A1U7JJX8_9HYPH|nr:hypothetical protein [Pseudovibrio exalbescens]OKL45002.1 hypothetical protein A3843_05300 [Pseudovibrio exalbescens]